MLNKSAVVTVLRVQHDLVFGKGLTTLAEYSAQAVGDGTLNLQFWSLYPFSRGSVHLASSNVSMIDEPRIDPRFNLVDFDVETQIQIGKLARKLRKTDALSSIAAGRILPSLDVLPENATEAQWRDFTKTSCESTLYCSTRNQQGFRGPPN